MSKDRRDYNHSIETNDLSCRSQAESQRSAPAPWSLWIAVLGKSMHRALTTDSPRKSILHLCKREILRPLREQILRISGFDVDSATTVEEALSAFWTRHFDLVLIDVDGDAAVQEAERLCSEVKSAQRQQLVAFVCNWRVAIHTECPDEILRTEFDPEALVAGIRRTLVVHKAKKFAMVHATASFAGGRRPCNLCKEGDR